MSGNKNGWSHVGRNQLENIYIKCMYEFYNGCLKGNGRRKWCRVRAWMLKLFTQNILQRKQRHIDTNTAVYYIYIVTHSCWMLCLRLWRSFTVQSCSFKNMYVHWGHKQMDTERTTTWDIMRCDCFLFLTEKTSTDNMLDKDVFFYSYSSSFSFFSML